MSGPHTLQLDIANACNADCVMCWHHSPLLTEKLSAQWKRGVLSAERVAALLDDMSSLGGLRHVNLAGKGDPLVHPEIEEIFAAIKTRGLRLGLTSNLAAHNSSVALGADEVKASIHGGTEPTYLAMHPNFRRAHWIRLHGCLAALAAAGRIVRHVHVITTLNAMDLKEMVRLGARYGAARVDFKLASLGAGTEAVRITEEQRRLLADEWIQEAEEEARRLQVAVNLDAFAWQVRAGRKATVPIEEVGCHLGRSYARVNVDGTVLYCCNPRMVVGQLDEARFSEMWEGEQWEHYRASLARGEYFEGCRRCGSLARNIKLARQLGREVFGVAHASSEAPGSTQGGRTSPSGSTNRRPLPIIS